jgi:pimeloyl-ACP methyl ester carboxylesterase
VWGLDLPGHGTAAAGAARFTSASAGSRARCHQGALSLDLRAVAAYVAHEVRAAGLWGCYAVGHSAGGALALLAASEAPGLFSGVACFEAVAATPASHALLAQAAASGAITTSGQQLTQRALLRRARFDSRAAATQQLSAKPPFAAMHPACLAAYVEHGLAPGDGAAAAAQQLTQQQPTQQQPTQQQPTQQQPTQQQQQQQQCGVTLVCAPAVEAAYYAALDPPPALQPARVTCPVLLAVSPLARAGHGASAAQFAQHAAVRAWVLQGGQPRAPAQQQQRQQSGGSRPQHSPPQLHAILPVLNAELAALLPTARLCEVPGVSHFGPLEQPQQLATVCEAFFRTCPHLPAAQGRANNKL